MPLDLIVVKSINPDGAGPCWGVNPHAHSSLQPLKSLIMHIPEQSDVLSKLTAGRETWDIQMSLGSHSLVPGI